MEQCCVPGHALHRDNARRALVMLPQAAPGSGGGPWPQSAVQVPRRYRPMEGWEFNVHSFLTSLDICITNHVGY